MVWAGYERSASSEEIAEVLALSTEQVERVIADVLRKQRTTAYLRMPALGVDNGSDYTQGEIQPSQ